MLHFCFTHSPTPDPVGQTWYSAKIIEESVSEVATTMSLEGMNLSDEEKDTLRLYLSGKVSGDELRQKIMEKVQRELQDS